LRHARLPHPADANAATGALPGLTEANRRWWTLAGACMSLGPLLGGALVETVSWRWLFWLNLPFCLLGVVLVLASTAEQRDETAARRIDAPGVITVGLGLAAAWVGTPALLRARQRGLNGLAGAVVLRGV
jgi:MFS family permease